MFSSAGIWMGDPDVLQRCCGRVDVDTEIQMQNLSIFIDYTLFIEISMQCRHSSQKGS